MSVYHDLLKQYWGFDSFRPLQLEIIESVGRGASTLGLMPTGGGKSLTFQVPAMAHDGLCLVVSPLIALMKDQVDNLRRRGIKAAAIYSGMTQNEIIETLDNCELGDFKFLYVSPERLGTDFFRARLQYLNVTMLAVDEAHCISQWGYDFRPSYLKIADVIDILPPNTPILALTATATPEVVDDIQEKLRFPKKNVFRKSFERDNLSYLVRHIEDKQAHLLRILTRTTGSAIVYARSRQRTRDISALLQQAGLSSDYFHAGLTQETKDERQAAWTEGRTRIIVATNAFGMGIDKPDVRTVVHYDLPDSIEAYFQEAGRAGRDEQAAYPILLFSPTDATRLKRRVSDSFPQVDFVKQVYQELAEYLTLAVGVGYEAVFPFDLNDFCALWHHPINQTFSALKILEYAGYIELTEEIDNPSKLMFTASRDELYHFRENNRTTEALIELLLRSYTGLFASPVNINESQLAKRLETTRDAVYDHLVMLSKLNIVNYIPLKKTPLLIYTRSRVENKELVIPHSAYRDRKARYETRIEAMLGYAADTEVCLSRFLLTYFGETATKDCGQCSVCRSRAESKLSADQTRQLEQRIFELLSDAPLTLSQLVDAIDSSEETIVGLLRALIDRGAVAYNKQMKLIPTAKF